MTNRLQAAVLALFALAAVCGRLVKATLVDTGQVYSTDYKSLEAEGRY